MGLKPVKVSQLNSYIKRLLNTDPILGNISVVGEISNLKFHNTGHVYFSLKDESSRINCFLASGNLHNIDFELREGMEVTANGYIYLYERGGSYSLNIRSMETEGQGELAIAFEKLKKKLEKEGMFDRANKKELPFFPKKIAVVTSPVGAAVRDIVKIITSRNDCVDVFIYPVLVQGPSAPAEIAEAIDDLNENYSDIDVIITGRGGGSMEELMAFNDEGVARSIFASEIPVISAVGHETDFTIADFVADVRAETPTAAAHIAVPDTWELREHMTSLRREMKRNLSMIVQDRVRHLAMLDPKNFGRDLQGRIALEQMSLDNIIHDMENQIQSMITSYKNRLTLLEQVLESANPEAVLKKGYSVVTDEDGKIIKDVSVLSKDQIIKIGFSEGYAKACVMETGKER